MNKIEHIGIAVKDMATAMYRYEQLLGTTVYKIEDVPSEGVRVAFLQCGPNKIELLEATTPDSPIAKYIEKRGEGIHHIAFDVDDIGEEMAILEAEGFVLLNKPYKQGADNKRVCFLHPKSTHGALIELCEEQIYIRKAIFPDLNTGERIHLFEFRRKLRIPTDMANHFKQSDDEIDGLYNNDMFTFYKFDEFKPVAEEVGGFPVNSSFRGIVDTLPDNENCFVFAEHSIFISMYAIRLHPDTSAVNEIYCIIGNDFKVVADSFTEFMKIYHAGDAIRDLLF